MPIKYLSVFAISVLSLGAFLTGCEGEKVSMMKPAVSKLVESAQHAKEGGNIEMARCRLESALLLEPDNSIAQYNMGIIEVEAEHFDAAIKAFEAALKNAPNSLDNQFALASTYFNYAQSKSEGAAQLDESSRVLYQKAQGLSKTFLDHAPQDDASRSDAQTIYEESKARLGGGETE